jgi:hypothetical protein
LRQRKWSQAELQAVGFQYYETRKRVVMARLVSEARSIEMTLETLIVGAGDIICYDPGDTLQPSIDDYDHWPVKRDLFLKTYRPWDDPLWRPSEPAAHLMQHGCRPYYKAAGVWALRLQRDIYLQSLESPRPVLVPPGRWLCIGSKGEPYHMSDSKFRSRYIIPADQPTDPGSAG